MGKLTIYMVSFNGYVKLPEGKSHKVPLNHHFPIWFSYGFRFNSYVSIDDRYFKCDPLPTSIIIQKLEGFPSDPSYLITQ